MRSVLCDDHRLLLDAFATALRNHGHDVVAMETSRDGGFRAVLEHDPDVCILDLCFPDGSGLGVLEMMRTVGHPCRVLVLSARTDPELVDAAARAGAVGFLVKDESIEGILYALDRIAAGQAVLDPAVSRPAVSGPMPDRRARARRLQFLTPREREALRRISQGQNTKEIARGMHVAHSTARTHVQNVLTKLGVRSRLQAGALVAREGLAEELDDPNAGLRTSPGA
jgi:two-component system nitrate/nitrite response regulator NarL